MSTEPIADAVIVAYEQPHAAAWESYLAQTEQARDEYDGAIRSAKAERDQAYAHQHALHQIAQDRAFTAYNDAIVAAWDKYRADTDAARREREALIALGAP